MSSVNKKFKKTKCEKCGKSIYAIEDGHGIDDCLCPDCWNRWCKFHKENGARYMKAYPFKKYKIANPAYSAFLGKLGSEIGFVLS